MTNFRNPTANSTFKFLFAYESQELMEREEVREPKARGCVAKVLRKIHTCSQCEMMVQNRLECSLSRFDANIIIILTLLYPLLQVLLVQGFPRECQVHARDWKNWP